jgi:hypothetical protein
MLNDSALDDMLSEPQSGYAERAADEGIPVAAIARILATPFSAVEATLNTGIAVGAVLEMPRADWPPGSLKHKRLPAFMAVLSYADMMFLCRTKFRLTNLEAALVITLLRHERCDKTKLHNVVEQQRFARSSQPHNLDSSDPKMVDVMICKLRKKLRGLDERFVIETIWGGGYFVAPRVKDLAFALLEQPANVKITEVPDGQFVSPGCGTPV